MQLQSRLARSHVARDVRVERPGDEKTKNHFGHVWRWQRVHLVHWRACSNNLRSNCKEEICSTVHISLLLCDSRLKL